MIQYRNTFLHLNPVYVSELNNINTWLKGYQPVRYLGDH